MPTNEVNKGLAETVLRIKSVEKTVETGCSMLQRFFTGSVIIQQFKEEYDVLIKNGWRYESVITVMNVNLLRKFDDWMVSQGFIPFGWTGYEGSVTDDFYQGRFSRWFVSQEDSAGDPTLPSLLPNYTEYSGCRIQFVCASTGSLLAALKDTSLGMHGGNHHDVIHDRFNDILSGRKVVVFRDRDGSQHLFFAKYFSYYDKYQITQLPLDQSNGVLFEEHYFDSKALFGTQLPDGKPDIPHNLIFKLDALIRSVEGASFFACWMGLYISRLFSVYGGYLPCEADGFNVQHNAAMNRIYLAAPLLAENHIYLPTLDTENTAIGNHLVSAFQRSANVKSSGAVALTATERFLDASDQGEETVIVGGGLPGVVISIPCNTSITSFAFLLANNLTNKMSCDLSLEERGYLMQRDRFHTPVASQLQYLKQEKAFSCQTENSKNSFFCAAAAAVSDDSDMFQKRTIFKFDVTFCFYHDLVHFLTQDKIIGGLSLEEINSADDNGDTLLIFATKNGNAELVLKLIEYGANPNIANSKTLRTPHEIALQFGHVQVACILQKPIKVSAFDSAFFGFKERDQNRRPSFGFNEVNVTGSESAKSLSDM